MGAEKHNAICFLVHSDENHVTSFCYRVWARNTSFYVKTRGVSNNIKISLHGPDPRPEITEPGFKVAIDGSVAAVARENTLWHFEPDAHIGWFPGAAVTDQATHVARIRVPWSSLQLGAPSAPRPEVSSRLSLHGKLQAPQIYSAVDVDLYSSDAGTPYWPDYEQVQRDNAGIGPLTNGAGQFLTAVVTHRSVWRDPATAELDALAKNFGGPRKRTLSFNRDDSGFLWIRELVMPASMLRTYSEDELREATRIPPRP